MREVEILVELKASKEKALTALKRFKFKGTNRVKDIYFYHPELKILRPESNGRFRDCLRIRYAEGKGSVAYKKDFFGKGDVWSHSEEHESLVEYPENVETLLKSVGFKELVVVDNMKSKYVHSSFEVVLEDVRELGLFLEVEYKGNSKKQVRTIKNDIYKFISALGLKFSECNMGKPEMLYRQMKNKV